MRRRTLFAVLTCFGLTMAACSDRAPTSPPATDDIQLQPAQVDALLAQNPSILELRMQSDELLREPARTLARFALAKVQYDINYKRPTLYTSSLIFAAIPLIERKLNRIPEERVGRLIDLLCTLQQLIGPKLPETSRLNMIPWCQLNPEELGNEAEFKLITNAEGGTVKTNTDQLALTVAANSMRDAADRPVSNVFFTVLPVERRAPGSEAEHPCPQPFTEESLAGRDCYPEFYEITSRPLVQFVDTPALLEVCQLDPHSESSDAPSHTVLARLQLFARSATGAAKLLPKFIGEGEDLEVNQTACDGDGDLGHTEIGPIGLSKDGLRNAWLALGRAGSRALEALGPKTLYASNVPTHGRMERELIDLAGTVVGAIDAVGDDVEPSSGLINGDFEDELTGWTLMTTTGNATISLVENGENGSGVRLAGNLGPVDEDCTFISNTNNFAALGQRFSLTKNQRVEIDIHVPGANVDQSPERVCPTFERTSVHFDIEGNDSQTLASGSVTIDFSAELGVTGSLQVNDNVLDISSSTPFNPAEFDDAVSVGGLTISHSPVANWFRLSFEVSDGRFPWLTDNVNFRINLRNEDHKTGREFVLTADNAAVRPLIVIP